VNSYLSDAVAFVATAGVIVATAATAASGRTSVGTLENFQSAMTWKIRWIQFLVPYRVLGNDLVKTAVHVKMCCGMCG
jgi:hypothetical protein